MKTANMTINKGQVYSVGNYLMNGKVLGKGHFARVEEATHRIIGKKVAIKVIDLTCIKEEYARRNLHREPRVMARLRHPCIAALYETMMHGPRLYVVMEAAGGGDLCAHVLGARGTARGLPEARARALATQLVSAVRHMHARGVVHRDLKMENIMLDTTKQFIKIVDFGLSNIWNSGAALRTPCGSLEYAAPELFIDGRRYGPEVDLWSIGVIVFGMVTGGLPFTGGGGAAGEGKSRPQLRAAISRGFSRKQRAALACVSNECKLFIQQLLEPNVEQRMKIEDAAKHRWVKRPGMRMKTHPLATIDAKINREMYRQIGDLCGQNTMDVITQIKAEPFGSLAGIYNIKAHLHQMQSVPGTDLLWSSNAVEPRPITPPEYRGKYEENICTNGVNTHGVYINGVTTKGVTTNGVMTKSQPQAYNRNVTPPYETKKQVQDGTSNTVQTEKIVSKMLRPNTVYGLKPPLYKVYDNGDCPGPRLPSIEEHCNDTNESKVTRRCLRAPCVRKISLEEERPRLNSCPVKTGDKTADSYRKTGDGFPSWRSSTGMSSQPRILLQNNATNIKRASLGNIISPHSSTNGHCRSEHGTPVGWYSTRSVGKETTHLQRLRRTVPMK